MSSVSLLGGGVEAQVECLHHLLPSFSLPYRHSFECHSLVWELFGFCVLSVDGPPVRALPALSFLLPLHQAPKSGLQKRVFELVLVVSRSQRAGKEIAASPGPRESVCF